MRLEPASEQAEERHPRLPLEPGVVAAAVDELLVLQSQKLGQDAARWEAWQRRQ